MEFLRRDGVALGYRLAEGDGDPVVLVHGWCCDHTFMQPQFDHFAKSGRSVLSLDLRGHGDSDKPVQDYPMSGFSDDIVWMVRELGLERPVVVGHSMGGVIAFDLAVRYPDFPAAIVVLDSSIALTATARAGMSAFIEALAGVRYKDAVEEYAARVLFIETDDADRRRRILASMVSAPQSMMVAAFTGLRDFDPAGAEQRIVAPSLYIAADEPQPRSDMARLHDLIPHLHYGRVVGSGHFCQLEVPDQVNAMIDRFLKVTSVGPAG
jgi:pimeloyl-ACP methyl ester carboxylesterase